MAVVLLILRIVFFAILGILALALLLLAIALSLRIRVWLRWDGEFQYRIKLAGFSLDSLLSRFRGKKKPASAAPQPTDTAGQWKRIRRFLRHESSQKPLSEILETVSALIRESSPVFRKQLKHIHISTLRIDAVIAGEDAARTALTYGNLCAALGALTPLIYDIFTVGDLRIGVRADFLTTKSDFRGEGTFTTTLWALPGAALYVLRVILRQRTSKISARTVPKPRKAGTA